MKSALKDYVSSYEKDLNVDLMKKSNDRPLVEYVKDSWKSLEVVPAIKIIDFQYTEKESEIDINKHIFKREKKKKKKDRYDYKFIKDDRYGKLTVKLEITIQETDANTEQKFNHVYPITKTMLIPLQDEDGYFYIKGQKYYLIWQMVEKSTYTSNSSVTLKSLMPIAVKRNIIEEDEVIELDLHDDDKASRNFVETYDVIGKHYVLPYYTIYVFRKEIPVLLFYLASGASYTLDYLGASNVIKFVDSMPNVRDKNSIYFSLSTKCILVVDRKLFDKYPYIQSIVGGFINVCTNRVSLASLEDPSCWIKKIANPNNLEKGQGILKFFNRLLDQTTKDVLKIHPYHKENIYSLLRWIMQEFNELRMKDNMDLANKRLRCNEYASAPLTQEFSKRLNRIISMGDKATIESYRELFKFPGDILIQKMHSSGILRFDDRVNDMNFFSKFKFTTKGPHSIGAKNSNNIGIKNRGLHPSFLGYIDCLVCGNSDPGTSGTLSPFSNLKSLYFDDSNEPDNFAYLLQKDLEEKYKNTNIKFIKLDFETSDDYYNALMDLQKVTDDSITLYGTSVENQFQIVIEDNQSLDESYDDSNNGDEKSGKIKKKKKKDKE